MARRRMFSMDIVESDAFLDMPDSSQALYFHLGMYADDDGFVNPKRIVRMLGSNADDLKLLIAKRFLLEFDNGVVVVKHWTINNQIRKDRYSETQYKTEKKLLMSNENGAYTEVGNQMATKWQPKVTTGKVRLGKVNKKAESLLLEIIEIVNPLEKITANRIKLINRRLKENNESEILQAAQRFSKSKWHIENKQMSIDNLIRDSKFDKWLTESSTKKMSLLERTIMEREKQNALTK